MLSLREGPNIRKSYDAFTFLLNNKAFKLKAFIAQPVIMNTEIFDDSRDISNTLWGVYTSLNIKSKLNFKTDIYYFGNKLDNHNLFLINGMEIRHSIGVRAYKKKDKIQFDTEIIYQFGQINSQTISAFMFSSDIKYSPFYSNNKFICLNAQIFSGDKDGLANKIGTFSPISTKPPAFISFNYGAANMIIINPYIYFIIGNKIHTKILYHSIWRYSVYDALYNTPISNYIRPTNNISNTTDKHVLNQFSIETNYYLNRHIEFYSIIAYGLPGYFILNTGNGLNSFTFLFQASYKF